jgi:hypothetical protein
MTMTTPVWTAVPNSAMNPTHTGHREVVAEQPQEIHASRERERDREQDVRGFETECR